MTAHYSDILEKLRTEYQAVERYYGQTVYKLSKDGFVYLRYSKRAKGEKERYFFGLGKDAIDKLVNFDFSVIFVCGEEGTYFILNKEYIVSIIDGVDISSGRWLMNIYNTENSWYLKVSGKEKVDITDYKNRFDLIFSKVIYLEEEITKDEFLEMNGKPEIAEISEMEKIKSDLISNSTKSDEPSLFEEAITSCFTFLGFTCERIGTAGNTDVLISSPYRMIIEAKTTKRDSINKIYFTRLKQHREKYGADKVIVISNDYDPSVIRDAEIENALLIRTKTLCRIIDLSDDFPLSPLDLKYIFQLNGLLEKDDLSELENKFTTLKAEVNNFPVILKSIDGTKRSIDEIFGRYQMVSENSEAGTSDKIRFEAFIKFLALPYIGILINDNGFFFREISEDIALKRLKKLGGFIHGDP
jgi:hypothetical protein